MSILTMKFGGTSVGSAEAIGNVVEIVKRELQLGNEITMVVSAMSGVTDMLIGAVQMASKEDKWGFLSTAEKLRDKHEEALNALLTPGKDRDETAEKINSFLEQLVDQCHAICVVGEATPRVMDAIVSLGECMSSQLVAAALRQNKIPAQALIAGQFLRTDNNYGNANPDWAETERLIQEKLVPIVKSNVVPVLTGFIGATADGHPTTLGRGGSDYSGAIFAAYNNSDELVIWTDVDGVMTTDPRIDKRARVLPYVSYNEVGELAFYGAKVLHPKTVQPILNKGIPLRVRNTFNHTHAGTLIGPTSQPIDTVIKAVTCIKNVAMMTVSGRGMIGVPGIAGRTFLATARGGGASVLMISQSSSEQSFCFVVPQDKGHVVKHAIEAELTQEIARGDIDTVDLRDDIVIVTAVGAGMRGTPGVAGRVFSMMGTHRINVLMIAQGSSECSISFVVAESDLKESVVALHNLALETVTVS
jgi:bifunctional aspartokinase / homoserine dehydrogenase 1